MTDLWADKQKQNQTTMANHTEGICPAPFGAAPAYDAYDDPKDLMCINKWERLDDNIYPLCS